MGDREPLAPPKPPAHAPHAVELARQSLAVKLTQVLGMPMDKALELGKGLPEQPQAAAAAGARRGKPPEAADGAAAARDSVPNDCRTGAGELAEKVHPVDVVDAPQPTPETQKPRKNRGSLVPRDRIELPTRGFSIARHRKQLRALGPFSGATAAPVPGERIAVVLPRLPRRISRS